MSKTKISASIVVDGETIKTFCMAEKVAAKNGKDFCFLTDRQVKAAAGRLNAGERNIPDYSTPEGFGPWGPCDGGMVCYK